MCKEPTGTFYQFHNICKTGQDSKALTKGLLGESRMTTVRGIAFDKLGDGQI
jgi:aspartate/methionine/tyrosine aminotransferase